VSDSGGKRSKIPTSTDPSIPLATRSQQWATTSTAGKLASSAWLAARQLKPPITNRWEVEIALEVSNAEATFKSMDSVETRFQLNIYAEEWGYFFCHGGSASWIRVTDIPFVHGRDDHQLLGLTPPLRDIGSLVRKLEAKHMIAFNRQLAAIRSDIVGADVGVGLWVASL
jgi:hypothetical protein